MYTAKKSLSGTCVGTMQRARTLYYVPSNSSVTADRVSLAVSFVKGVKNYDCEINVRQRTTECKLV